MSTEALGRRHYVSIAGNIGVGKSTLVGILADAFGWQPYYELVADHPYIDDYYADRERWGFHSQIWFLSQRFEQQQEIADTPISVVQDRSLYEDYEVFVKGLLEQGILSHRDFRTYRRLYQALLHAIAPPTLLIYLRASVATLQRRIDGRARPAERQIPSSYLEHLNRRYEAWLRRFDLCPILTIDTDELDFVEREADRHTVIEAVRQAIGLPAEALVQPNLPGIDRVAFIGA
ncbi:deoxynucleoside kinase [Kallotenue papyrolyticum]|uniref:deoxynucleoside kinase n=1 Tax=Kallotenue papyrolyticum TaxID=1325125 RepID=UPI0004925A31|nr:deoxynucleoside kinase [Kallotenue papyrolyticum]